MRTKFLKGILSATAALAISSPVIAMAGTSNVTYTVQAGDTLWKISQKYSVTVSDLTHLNSLPNVNNLYIGEVLKLPFVNYTVQPGDVLWKIALKFGVTTADILAHNSLANPNALNIGQNLIIPQPSSSSAGSSSTVTPVPTGTVGTGTVATGTTKTGNPVIATGSPAATTGTPVIMGNTAATGTPAATGGSVSTVTPATTGTGNSGTTSTGAPATPSGSTQTTTVSSSQNALVNNIIATAEKYMGIPYLWGGTTPAGFDCSGFVQYVFGQNGITLPREAHDQANVGTSIPTSQLQPGDLLFFTNTYTNTYANSVTHVGIYIGNGDMIESSSVNNEGVVIVHGIFSKNYYISHYWGAKRVF